MSHCMVIGGSRGLGRVTAQAFLKRGDRVSLISRSGPAAAAGLDAASHFAADLADADATSGAFERAISIHGAPSYVVFCQRYRGDGDQWAGELAVTLTASKRAVDYLSERFAPGHDAAIIFVGSVFSDRVGEGQPAGYHVAKAGLKQLANFFAVSLGPRGIRVNTVSPITFLKDESSAFYLGKPALLSLYAGVVPLGRMATAEDSAGPIAFLCSPAAAYLTGQDITVDGGLSLVWAESLARRLTGV